MNDTAPGPARLLRQSVRILKILGVITALAALGIVVYSRDQQRAGVVIGYAGTPTAFAIELEAGKCDQSSPRLQWCGTAAGDRRVTLLCLGTDKPAAYLDGRFAPGSDSNYVHFNEVCGLTAEQIIQENQRDKQGLTAWGQRPKSSATEKGSGSTSSR